MKVKQVKASDFNEAGFAAVVTVEYADGSTATHQAIGQTWDEAIRRAIAELAEPSRLDQLRARQGLPVDRN